MTATTPSIDELVELFRNPTGEFTLDPDGQRHALTLLRTLARGAPVSPADLGAESGQHPDDAAAFIDGLPGVFRDEHGQVVGFWGLAIGHMPPHRYRVGGHDLFTWCAWDPLILTPWLGGNAHLYSVDPHNGEAVALELLDGEATGLSHPDLTLSFRVVEEWTGDVVASFCHYVHLFTDRSSAQAWTALHPGTFPLSLSDGQRLAHAWAQAVFPALDPSTD